MKTEYRQEIDRLIQVEYGERPEVVLRLMGVPLGAALLYLYTGWALAWIWPLGFWAAHACYFTFLKTRSDSSSWGDTRVAGSLFLVVLTSFVWLPGVMAAQSDIVLVFAGSTLMATVLVFLVQRGDTSRFLVVGELLVICGTYLAVTLSRPEPMAGIPYWGGLAVNLVLVGYLAQALLTSRKAKLAAVMAAKRDVQEQKMAAIGELAGGVAHDFNNMLTAIIGNIELSREVSDPQEREFLMQEAHEAAKRAEAVVKQLLIYARKAPSFQSDLDLTPSAPRMMELARRLIPKHVEATFDVKPGPLVIRVDETHLMTALINLVVNAVDAMPDGGKLRVAVRPRDLNIERVTADGTELAPGKYVVISVTDTGTGIAPNELPKVVQPFHSSKSRGQGAGLGLPLVLGFARDHGGGLCLTSSDEGTLAEIWLPCRAQSDVAEQTKTPPR